MKTLASAWPWMPWVLFAGLCAGLTVSQGLHMGDDSYFATIAKSVALGEGYSTPFAFYSDVSAPLKFNPYNGTGPTVTLPAALGIALFGNGECIPGLTAIIGWFLPFALLLRRVQTRLPLRVFGIFSCLLMGFYILGFAGYFGPWIGFLGEASVLGWVSLAHWWAAEEDLTLKNTLFLGVATGLAVQAKQIALFQLAGVPAMLLWRLTRGADPIPWPRRLAVMGVALVGLLVPNLLFEGWKLMSLGGSGYLRNWREYREALSASGGLGRPDFSILASRLGQWATTYKPWPLVILPITGLLAIRRTSLFADVPVRIISALVLSAGIGFAYWLSAANGWVRYAWIPTGLGLLAAAFALISWRLPRPALPLVISILAVLVGFKIPSLTEGADRGLFRPSNDRLARARVLDTLLAARSSGPVVFCSRWWGSFADIEYLMPDALNFRRLESLPADAPRTLMLVNRNFMDVKEPISAAQLARSRGVLLKAGHYEIHELP